MDTHLSLSSHVGALALYAPWQMYMAGEGAEAGYQLSWEPHISRPAPKTCGCPSLARPWLAKDKLSWEDNRVPDRPPSQWQGPCSLLALGIKTTVH